MPSYFQINDSFLLVVFFITKIKRIFCIYILANIISIFYNLLNKKIQFTSYIYISYMYVFVEISLLTSVFVNVFTQIQEIY